MKLGESTLFRSEFDEIGDTTFIKIEGWFRPLEDVDKNFFTKLSKALRQLFHEIKFDLGVLGDYIIVANAAKSGIRKGKQTYYDVDITLHRCKNINQPLVIDYVERFLQGYENISFSPRK